MDKALNFSEHLSSKINKANRNLGLIFRTFTYMDKEMFLNFNIQINCPSSCGVCGYCVYASLKKDMVAIENVQMRATKLVRTISHLTYQERLECLGLPSLEYRRERADLVEVYKIMNGISDVDKEKFFTISNYTATQGHSMKFAKRRQRLKVRSNSFSI